MSAELLPCPFCGNAPKLRIDSPQTYREACWSWVDCTKCFVKPHVGASCGLGYSHYNYPYQWVPVRTAEEASAKATEDVIRRWNERAPVVKP